MGPHILDSTCVVSWTPDKDVLGQLVTCVLSASPRSEATVRLSPIASICVHVQVEMDVIVLNQDEDNHANNRPILKSHSNSTLLDLEVAFSTATQTTHCHVSYSCSSLSLVLHRGPQYLMCQDPVTRKRCTCLILKLWIQPIGLVGNIYHFR